MKINFYTNSYTVTVEKRNQYAFIQFGTKDFVFHRHNKPDFIRTDGYKTWFEEDMSLGFCTCSMRKSKLDCRHPELK